MSIKLLKIRLQCMLQGNRTGKVIRREHVTLDFAKDDCHLVQPPGIGGQPVEAHLKGEVQGGDPRGQLFGGVGGTVVQDEMKHLEPLAEHEGKELTQEDLEVGKAAARIAAGDSVPGGNQQAAKQLPRPHAPLAVGHLDRRAGHCRLGLMQALARLDGSFLIGTADPLLLGGQQGGGFVEVQHGCSLLHKLRIGGVLPGMIPPGLDFILASPAPDSAGRAGRDHPLFHRHLSQFLARPALPHLAVGRGLATSQGDNLRPHQRWKVAWAPRAGPRRQRALLAPASPPLLDPGHRAAYRLSNLTLVPGRPVVGQEQNAGALHLCIGGPV